MAKRDLKTTSQNLFLADESELPVEILDGIAGGIVGVSKPKEESKEANIGAATDAAPEFQHTGTTQASASAGVVNGTATASAGASAGHTQQGTLGDVIVTNKYTISAAANATASPTGVGAGATVGAGVSTTFDLGKNVEIETATTISGKVGVAVGVENGSLKGTVGAKAGVESSVEQRYTSDTFGDGAKVKQTAYAKAEISAEAGAEGTLGAGGAKMKTVTTAGAAYRAGATAEVGNDTATSKVSAGVISPGAFSQGVTGGATYDGGKLKLEIGGEIAIGIAGASLKLDLGLQLFDNTHTVGSDKEIKDVETAIKTIAASAGGMLTDTLQRDLAQDAAEAKQVAQRATLGRSDAQRSADQYNQQVEKRADEMEDKLKEVLELKAKVSAQPASQKNADQLKNLAGEEKEVRNKIGQWQKEMESPEEVKKRSQIQNNLIIQEKRADLLQDVAQAIETRAEMVKKIDFVGTVITAELTMTKAENALETKEREYQLKMQSLANFDKEFSKVESQVNKELKEIAADRDSLLLEMKKGSNPRLENILKDINTREDRVEAQLTQMEERKASIPSVLEQLDAQRAEAREEFAAVKQQMTRLHPIWSIEADVAQAREMSDQIRKTMADKKDATPLERGLMEASLEASQLMERLLSGNADQLKSMQKSFDEITANLQTEYARLTEVVTDKGVLSTVADEISSWF